MNTVLEVIQFSVISLSPQFLLTHHRYQEAGEVLNHTSGLMEEYHGDKETLIRTFYLIVQVSHLLVAGQVKAAKPHLKQLQQRVKVSLMRWTGIVLL